MSTRQVRLDHRVIHVGDRPRSNAFYRDVLGAEVPYPTGVGDAHRSPGGGHPNPHGPGAVPTPPARVPVPPGGGEPCFEWPGPVAAAAAAHLDRRGTAVELGPLRRPGECGFGQSAYESVRVRDPDGHGPSPEFISDAAP